MKKYLLRQCQKHDLKYLPNRKLRLLSYVLYCTAWNIIKRSVEKFDHYLECPNKLSIALEDWGKPFHN